jgi:hypothetical protein
MNARDERVALMNEVSADSFTFDTLTHFVQVLGGIRMLKVSYLFQTVADN